MKAQRVQSFTKPSLDAKQVITEIDAETKR